jgi:hypothetical protein
MEGWQDAQLLQAVSSAERRVSFTLYKDEAQTVLFKDPVRTAL